MTYEWRRLDLRQTDSRPRNGELVALKLTPSRARARFFDKNDIVAFRVNTMNHSPKPWRYGTRGVDDPVRMKKHHDIWWFPLPDADANRGGLV